MTMTQITQKQAVALAKGDVISRYPYNGLPQEVYNKDEMKLIEMYEVRSVNNATKMVELVLAANDLMLLPMPGDVSRIFIHQNNLATQHIWWTDDNVK